MTDERAFLDKLLENPADDTVRLVYADWLDERGETAKAEFLRLTAGPPALAADARLATLSGGIPAGWLAVASKRPIENCPAGRRRPLPVKFDYPCPMRWEALRATAADGVRFCDACRKEVYYCDTLVAARDHAARGRCVAVDVGEPRTPGDLDPIPGVVRLTAGIMIPPAPPTVGRLVAPGRPPARRWWQWWRPRGR